MGTSYTIQIAGKDFKVSSTDKEEHIRDVEKKLTSTFEELGSKSVDYQDSFKVALKLADELVRKEGSSENNYEKIEVRLNELLESLEKVC